MNPKLRRFLIHYAIALAMVGILFLIIRAATKVAVSQATLSFVAGGFAVLCLVGVVYGIWDARRIERRRKAKENIWINH